ncbi:MAG: heavy metal translocating P-type ATPase [bacterium]|nr:heavy metal translocating P-type ATPase [bacterium]
MDHSCCHPQDRQTPAPKGQDVVYTCPMHPEIIRDKPGMCPECGMALVPTTKKEKEHNKHEGHSTRMFLVKFWISLVLTLPIVAYSNLPELLLGWQAPVFPGSSYLGLVLGSMVFFIGGWIFLAGAAREIQGRLPGMMTLIALAITSAYAWSVYATFAGEMTLFWELATLITIMLLGHFIEMKSVQGARGALKELAKLLPDTAEVIQNAKIKNQNDTSKFKIQTKTTPIRELKVNDVVLVKPGERIPADGKIQEGQSDVDESIVTGESALVAKQPGDEVIAGTINGDGFLHITVTKIGEHTFLAGVMRLVEEAQSSKSRLQLLSDKAALVLTIIAVVAGTITLITWLALGSGAAFAVARLVAVLVIACPHALGLAVPLVASISTNMAASNGFLVKQRIALEQARSVDVVLFDKTGTLTKGEFGVVSVIPSPGFSAKDVLALGSAINQNSEHAIARAMVRDAEQKNIVFTQSKNFRRLPGKGASGEVEGKLVSVGSLELVQELGGQTSVEVADLEQQGKTIVYVMIESEVVGAVALADMIREESREAIQGLQKQGVKVAMITGDSKEVASWVASELGIDQYFARVLPAEKASIVKRLQEGSVAGFENWKLKIGNSNQRLVVAMVGDGINDAPALTQADLGIAIGAGTNVAIESAGIILMRNDPRDIARILRLSKLTYRKMIQNLFWATGYNVLAIPLAAGAMFSQGIVLDPAIAAVFMSASTVIVSFNALLLRRATL